MEGTDTMQSSLTSKCYERLNARERLSLVVQAMAREDRADTRRLWDTAPMKLYKAVDGHFQAGHDALRIVTYIVSYTLNQDVGRILMAAKLTECSGGLVRALAAEAAGCLEALLREEQDEAGLELGSSGDGQDREQAAVLARVDAETAEVRAGMEDFHRMLCLRTAKHAAEILAGFDAMTRRVVDTEAMTVLRAWMPPLAESIERLGILAQEPDAGNAERWRELCLRLWSREMGLHAPQDSLGAGQQMPT